MKPLLLLFPGVLFYFGGGCSRGPKSPPVVSSESTPVDQSWIGIYSSPAEIGGFSGTVLAIENKVYRDELGYRMTFYSDAVSSDSIDEPEKRGDVLADGDHIYIPTAFGYYHEGKPSLSADITRYTRQTIQGRTVLLRDDALKALQQENRLYDYGVLIKVSDTAEWRTPLDGAKHESIKVLYQDPSKEWKDPFVNGPNSR